MARPTKSRTSGLVAIVVTTAKRPDGVPVGYVEQFSITDSLRGELIYAIGKQKAAEAVLHGIDRVDVSWTATLTIPAEDYVALGIRPGDADLATYGHIDVTFIDNDRGEVICEVSQVIPQSLGLSTSAMAKLTENISLQGVQALWASELN